MYWGPRPIDETCDLPAASSSVIGFAANAYSEQTLHAYCRESTHWEIWARARGWEPDTPSPEQLCEFLEAVSLRYSAQYVRNMRNALSWRSRCLNIRGVARSELVNAKLRAIRESKSCDPPETLTLDHVRAMLARLGDEPFDVRDRALVLLVFWSGIHGPELSKITTNSWYIDRDSIVINIPGRRTPITVHRQEDRRVDLGTWLTKWTNYIPPGHLFPSQTRRGGWGTAMSRSAMWKSLRRLALAIGVRDRSVLIALRRGFIHDAVPVHGAPAVARHLNYQTLAAIAYHYPPLRSLNGAYRRRRRGSRPDG